MRNLNTICKFAMLASVVFIMGSCKKEIIPPPGATSPVFVADGTFGGETLTLHAGDNNVLMSTESAKIFGVDFYKGILGNSQVTLEMGLFAGDVDLQNPETPDYSNISELSFASVPSQPLYRIAKDSFPNHEQISYIEWKVDGESAPSLNVLEIYHPGKYQVCARVVFADYSEETVCNEIIVGFKTNADFELNFFIGQDHLCKAWIKNYGSPISSIQWFIDNVAIPYELDELNMQLDDSRHTVRAEVLFQNGVKRIKTVLIDGSLSGKNIPDFTKAGNTSAILWDYKAKIKLTKNGVDYFSHNTSNVTNKIFVDNIKYYGLNKAGKPVYILTGTVKANLKNASGMVLPLNLNVSFGFAVE